MEEEEKAALARSRASQESLELLEAAQELEQRDDLSEQERQEAMVLFRRGHDLDEAIDEVAQ